jgi:hypothetical protein
MAKWNKLKVALLVGALLPVMQFSCVTDLIQDVLIALIYD